MNMYCIRGFVIGAVSFLIAGVFISLTLDAYNHDVYTGKLLLTNQEYYIFKEALTQPSVVVNSVTSLSSDNPYVGFTVTVPRGYNFEFGEKSTQEVWVLHMIMGSIFCVGGLACCVSGLLAGRERNEGDIV